jgi:uncharacterized protein (DUF486 family)
MNDLIHTRWLPVALLVGSNVFMTFAWYGHLKHKDQPLWLVILVSWGIAFFEYCLMVPANRWGSGRYTATELKIIQEVVTLTVFSGFAVAYLGEKDSMESRCGVSVHHRGGRVYVFAEVGSNTERGTSGAGRAGEHVAETVTLAVASENSRRDLRQAPFHCPACATCVFRFSVRDDSCEPPRAANRSSRRRRKTVQPLQPTKVQKL